MKAFGIDLMERHRDDFPPDYVQRIEAGRNLSALDLARDQAIRSEVYDAIQGVLATHDILVSPTLAAMPVDNAPDGDTKGPTHVDGVEVDPLIGWCLTYLTNFSGHPSASVPAGIERRPAGRDAADRAPIRRRRRPRGGCGCRADAAMERRLSQPTVLPRAMGETG